VIIYGFYLAQFSTEIILPRLLVENPQGYYDYRGAVNVQSNLGRGSGSISEVIQEAKKTGLDFLIMTDAGKKAPGSDPSGYYSNLLVLYEREQRLIDARLLILGDRSPALVQESSLFLTDLISQRDPQSREAMVILAHPFFNGPTWVGEFPPGIDALEVMNPRAMSHQVWVRSKGRVLMSLFVYLFNPRLAFLRLYQEPEKELALWDFVNSTRKLFATGGAEATARAMPANNFFIQFPSYQSSFEIVSNHILLSSELTGRFFSDRAKVMQALKNGNSYVALNLLGNPKGFLAIMKNGDFEYLMGSSLPYRPGLELKVNLPRRPIVPFEVVILKDGVVIFSAAQTRVDFTNSQPGVYRVEVRVQPRLAFPEKYLWAKWILTNPFFVY
jgi:hypothetical protein